MNDFLDFIIQHSGLSIVNTALLWTIFVLVRQRYQWFVKDFETQSKRIARLEKTLWKSGLIYEVDHEEE